MKRGLGDVSLLIGIRRVGLLSLLIAGRPVASQGPDVTARHAWIGAGLGGGTLGVTQEASAWITGDRLAVGARWSQTIADWSGTGDEHELTALVGVLIPTWRSTLVPAVGIARAGGCYTLDEFERCNSLGVEAAPAWGLELDAPVTRVLGIHVAGFGVVGQRTRYVGLSAGLSVGSFP